MAGPPRSGLFAIQDRLPVLLVMKQGLSAVLSFSVAAFPILAAYCTSNVHADLCVGETDQLRVQLVFRSMRSRC
jgi:hypothetical protein